MIVSNAFATYFDVRYHRRRDQALATDLGRVLACRDLHQGTLRLYIRWFAARSLSNFDRVTQNRCREAAVPGPRAIQSIALDAISNRIQQLLVPKRLGKKFYRASFYDADRHRNVGMGGKEYDRGSAIRVRKLRLIVRMRKVRSNRRAVRNALLSKTLDWHLVIPSPPSPALALMTKHFSVDAPAARTILPSDTK
jgi:hypothetical protein